MEERKKIGKKKPDPVEPGPAWEDETLPEWERWELMMEACKRGELDPHQMMDIADSFSVETRQAIKKQVKGTLFN